MEDNVANAEDSDGRSAPTAAGSLSGASLEELASRVQARDREAFAEVVRQLQEPLYFAVLRLVGHQADARDIVQRTFLRAWTRIEGLKSPGALRSWLFSIGLNLARNHRRDRGGRTFEPVEENTASVDARASDALVRREERQLLRQSLESLPPRQKEVVTLRIDSELSFREIGELVGCSEGSARVNFHHGLKRLREQMVEAHGARRQHG